MSGDTGSHSGPTLVSHAPDPLGPSDDSTPTQSQDQTVTKRRSAPVNEDSGGPPVNIINDDSDTSNAQSQQKPRPNPPGSNPN